MDSEKERVVALLKSVGTPRTEPLSAVSPDHYVQHNLGMGDGLGGLKAALQTIPPNKVHIEPVRVFQDGDFVFVHTRSEFFGPKVGFEIFRFDKGRIVEHWDNGQAAAPPNSSGHGMTDGPVRAADLHKTESNKALVRRFVQDILVEGRMERLAGYFDGDHYIQHNPNIGDGVATVRGALKAAGIKYDRIHLVLGEGDFVLVTSEGKLAGKLTSFYDLFRVEKDKIAEHWDTLEPIPPRAEWKNQNGKF
jgi:predicted SnoaL-like aldol condensation-catalyzing enzyme